MKKRKKTELQSKKSKIAQKEQIAAISEKVFSSFIDIALWITVYCGNFMLPQSQYGAAYRAAQDADRFLQEVNYDTLKAAINNARKKGFITSPGKGKKAHPEITKAGIRRLKSVLPMYDEKRMWDKRVYLVTYDIAEKKRKDRNLFREYLKRIGCGMLQESVWITPYNPKSVLRDFIDERSLDASVIVSDIGTDGSIGNENLENLVARVYKLHDLNERYEEFLDELAELKTVDSFTIIRYLSILAKDPQLPFALLPPWWLGDKVWKQTKPHIRKHQQW